MKKYKHFITSGCSFSSGVINNPNNTLEAWQNQSFAWPHYCFLDMWADDHTFLNFAQPGNGITATFTSLIYYLELNKHITPGNTLIGFNLTGLERQDIPAKVDHPNANSDLATRDTKKELQLGWIRRNDLTVSTEQYYTDIMQQGAEEISNFNKIAAIQGITYLESRGFDYFFMLMTESIVDSADDYFYKFLDERHQNWVTFDKHRGMYEFVKEQQLATSDGHPSKEGHWLIASHVLEHLKNYE